jgi:hypothetical protein
MVGNGLVVYWGLVGYYLIVNLFYGLLVLII